jgi:hypothetical protein
MSELTLLVHLHLQHVVEGYRVEANRRLEYQLLRLDRVVEFYSQLAGRPTDHLNPFSPQLPISI